MKTRTRKVRIGFASSESLMNLPKGSRIVCRMSMEDDCVIIVITEL
jgi:hypothetical protein